MTRDGNKEHILIVDDEADIRFLFVNILRRRNLQLSCAENLADASNQIMVTQPNLILLDNSLPDGRGIDFIPYLKLHCPKAKIIVVTANDSPSDQRAAFLQGADDFLSKPLSLERVNRILDKMIISTRDSPVL